MNMPPTLSPEDLLTLFLALLIIFGPAAMHLLATLMAFRTSGRLRSAACILDRMIREAEERRARYQIELRMRRGMRRRRQRDKDSPPAVLDEAE